jgi:ketosteroid isomerase-like protein
MRFRTLAALASIAPLFWACGATPIGPADIDAIDSIRTAYQNAIQAGDGAAVLALYADGAVEMPPNMPIRNGKSAIEEAAAAEPQPTTFSLTPVETDGVGDLAYDRGTYSASVMIEGMEQPVNDTGKYFVLLRKQGDGSWLITTSIWNSDLPVPAEPPM